MIEYESSSEEMKTVTIYKDVLQSFLPEEVFSGDHFELKSKLLDLQNVDFLVDIKKNILLEVHSCEH